MTSLGYTFEPNYDFLFKIIVVGDASVGKTCIIHRFARGGFPTTAETIGVDFFFHKVELDDDKVKIQIWDTAGQDRFISIIRSYYRGAHAVVYTYDVTNPESLEHIETLWMKETRANMNDNAIPILIGNKADHRDKNDDLIQRAQELAAKYDMPHFTVSALNGDRVHEAFMDLTSRCLTYVKKNEARLDQSTKRRLFVREKMDTEPKPAAKWWCNIL